MWRRIFVKGTVTPSSHLRPRSSARGDPGKKLIRDYNNDHKAKVWGPNFIRGPM